MNDEAMKAGLLSAGVLVPGAVAAGVGVGKFKGGAVDPMCYEQYFETECGDD